METDEVRVGTYLNPQYVVRVMPGGEDTAVGGGPLSKPTWLRVEASHNSSEIVNDDSEEEEVQNELMFENESSEFYANRISAAEYQRQATEGTKMAVESLVSSPEYQRRHTRCQLCWCVWAEGQFSTSNCPECGGHAMTRPCPICEGRCGVVWTRDVELSHHEYRAHWEGDCLLPPDQRQAHLTQYLLQHNDDIDLTDGMDDLSAS